MRENLTHAIEDYLKTIYDLTLVEGRATTSRIAERLEITPASVTGMVQKLAAHDPPLVTYRKHRGVTLTPEGEKVAIEIIRHHRLLELYLHETMGYTWDEVHAEADRLEHVISEEFEDRMAEALGHPKHDPHGDPIPSRDLKLPHPTTIPLEELRPGERGVVRRVRDDNPELLRYLSDIQLTPKARFEVVDYSPFDGNLHLEIEGQEGTIVLGPRVTRRIFVERPS